MTKRFQALLLSALLPLAAPALAAGGGDTEPAYTNIGNQASLQRGAALFMNYCFGCHSLQFQRYSRMAEDLGLTEEQVMASLNPAGAKFGETMVNAMDAGDGEAWLGAAPPDLSVTARVRGSDWIYTFLKSFYVDESRPLGWNNKLFPGASMPHVLWELQGVQRPVFEQHGDTPVVARLELAQPGRLDAEQYEQVARDITTFLEYVGEPAALKRQQYGVWVILFLAVFTFLAWLLKKEYWRDVH